MVAAQAPAQRRGVRAGWCPARPGAAVPLHAAPALDDAVQKRQRQPARQGQRQGGGQDRLRAPYRPPAVGGPVPPGQRPARRRQNRHVPAAGGAAKARGAAVPGGGTTAQAGRLRRCRDASVEPGRARAARLSAEPADGELAGFGGPRGDPAVPPCRPPGPGHRLAGGRGSERQGSRKDRRQAEHQQRSGSPLCPVCAESAVGKYAAWAAGPGLRPHGRHRRAARAAGTAGPGRGDRGAAGDGRRGAAGGVVPTADLDPAARKAGAAQPGAAAGAGLAEERRRPAEARAA